MSVAVEYNPEPDEPESEAVAVKNRHEAELMQMPGVTGCGVGRNAVGDPAIVLYVEERAAAGPLPRAIEGVEVVVEVTGPIETY